MKFYTTPLQWKIIKQYWKEKKPFSLSSLREDGLLKNKRWGGFALKRMVAKGQIIRLQGEGEARYIGTTDSRKEWELTKDSRPNPLFDVEITEDFGTGGLNKYEKDQVLDEMSEMIQEKIREIQARREGKNPDSPAERKSRL